ncbi:MAG TPA: hypothetical protein VIL18_01825 [Longimicrobiales bacterium]
MRITVNIPDPVGQEAEELAREEGMSVSALFASAVERYLEQRRRERAIERIGALIGTARVAPDALEMLECDRRASDRSGL